MRLCGALVGACALCVVQEKDPQPLILHMLPLTCTFAFFNDGNDVVRRNAALGQTSCIAHAPGAQFPTAFALVAAAVAV